MPLKKIIDKGCKTSKERVSKHDIEIKVRGSIDLKYKPSEWYWRNALRNSPTKEKALEIGMALIFELEEQKNRLIRMGHQPVVTFMIELEALEKNIYYEG